MQQTHFKHMKLIEKHIEELKHLCGKHQVSEFYVFGSYAKGTETDKSDIDFLVGFEGVDPLNYFDNYFDLKENLTHLFSKEIDLVEIKTLRNPILKKSIDRDKILMYGRANSKMAV